MWLDGHSDILWDVARRRKMGEENILERLYLPRLKKGGVEGLVMALWTDPRLDGDLREEAAWMLHCATEEVGRSGDWLVPVQSAEEARSAVREGKIYAFFALEGMAALGEDLRGIDRYREWGVRMATLTWNEENLLATGAWGDRYSPLTQLGQQAVRRMGQQGMAVDVSHLNEGGFWDVMRRACGPVLASHANCRALCNVPRNLSDEQLRAIRDRGGVVGLNAYHGFIHSEPERQTVQMLAHHAAHMAEIMGPEHVACGFDFGDFMADPSAQGLGGWEELPGLSSCLAQVGFSPREREMIARENLLRVLR